MNVPEPAEAAVDRISAIYLRISRIVVSAVSIFMLATMVVVNGVEIVGRALFATSFSWVQEISILAAMWVYFFAYALVAKSDDYIRVDLITRFISARSSRALDILTRLVTLAFHSLVLWFGIETFRFLGLFKSAVLDWPESLFVLPIVLGSADIVLTETIRLRGILKGRSLPSPASPLAE
jgi:TRAP-type C4-dicarboxylate transport system permease small subunit